MIYDYKSKELVQDVIIQCLCPIVDDVIDEYHTLRRDENLSIYAPSYIAREILGRLLDVEDVNEDECENEFWIDAESDNYLLYKDDNEVVITIGYDGMIFVEGARVKDGRILRSESVLTYVYDEFPQKDVEKLSRGEYSVLVFGFADEDMVCDDVDKEVATKEETDDKVEYDVKSDDDGYSITVRCNLDADEAMKVIKDMENRMERMNDMFREMDNFRRLLRF